MKFQSVLLLVALFSISVLPQSRSAESSVDSWSLAELDQLLSETPADQKLVQIGDMQILTPALREWRARQAGEFVAASAFGGLAPMWTGGNVYYTFDASVTVAKQKAFLDGAAEWAMFANLRFTPRSVQANYITIRENPTLGGGQSALGMVGGQQFLEIGPGAWSRAIICHEIGHALGLIHEHQRSDRDSYVTILTANITPGYSSSFVKLGDSLNSGPYDFLSVMHYRRDGFSTSPGALDTIQPLPAYAQYLNLMGQQFDQVLSPGDRAGMAAKYGAGPALSSVVSNTLDSGPGSLRAALYYALDHPGTTVTFNIPASDPGFAGGVFTIRPTDNFPGLMRATILDGSSQPGNSNPSGPEIVLNGALCDPVSVYSDGLRLTGTNCVVQSLVINGFPGTGIMIDGTNATGNTVRGCFLGVNASGTAAVTNRYEGIVIAGGASRNTIGGTNVTARNIISGSPVNGLSIRGTGTRGNVVAGNYIGLNAVGTAALPNANAGLLIYSGAEDNVIGGTNAGSANIISGNLYEGLGIADTNTTGNVIMGNLVGLNAAGTAALPNRWQGVSIFNGAASNTVGGAVASARNVISGNVQQGLIIADAGTRWNVVAANYLGLNAAGTAAVPNGWSGVQLYGAAQNNTIGGTSAGARNVISGNSFQGMLLVGTNTSGNVIAGNYVGLSPAGTTALPNGWSGVEVYGAASGNLIGGTTPGSRNIISGNGNYGVYVGDGGTDANVIAGNYIGVDATGTIAVGNAWSGLAVFNGARGNWIGGSAPNAGNLISGNANYGVNLAGTGTSENFIQGNRIGPAASGSQPLANGWDGIALNNGASRNVIGVSVSGTGAGNEIAFNSIGGIVVADTATTGNTIRGNSIYSNTFLAINLIGFQEIYPGITLNDSGDGDTGPNQLQNFPVLTSAVSHDPVTVVSGTLNSTAGRTFLVDIYHNVSVPGWNHGEGRTFAGTTIVTTAGDGNAGFTVTLPDNLAGKYLSATATDQATGDTSELGETLQAISGVPSPTFSSPGTLSSTGFVATISLTAGQSYRVQATTNLGGNPIPWVNLTSFVATSTSFRLLDRTATNLNPRFYRVVSP